MRARALLVAAFLVAAGAGGVHAREPYVHRRGVRVVRAPTGEALAGDNWLLLVAIGKYREWGNLRGPRKDVAALKEALLDRYAFDAAHTVELYDEKATKAGIIGAFRDLGRRLGPEDSLLVYYAGHGHTDEFSRTGYWIPYDAGADTAVQERWLPNAAVRGYLREMKCSHVLLVSDSCFSGDLLDEQRGREPEITDAYFRRAYRMQARQVLTSGASEPVSDTGLGGRSAFAFHLVRTLERNRKPYLDPLELYVHVRAGVKGQMPLLGSLKGAGHQDGGAYIFFLRAGGRTVSTGTPDSSDAQVEALRRELEALKRRMEAARREGEAPAEPEPNLEDGREHLAQANPKRVSTKTGKRDFDRTIKECDKAIELDPRNADAYTKRGIMLLHTARRKEARSDFEAALKLDPSIRKARVNLAKVYAVEGLLKSSKDPVGSIRDYDKAIEFDPENAEYYRSRAYAKAARGDRDGAIRDISQVIRLNPNDAGDYVDRGWSKAVKGDMDGAIRDFEQAVILDPENARASNLLGLTYGRRGLKRSNAGDQDGAIQDFNRALEIDPRDASTYRLRGMARAFKEDWYGAIRDCNNALEINPRDASAYHLRGMAKRATGDSRGAGQDFETARRLGYSGGQ